MQVPAAWHSQVAGKLPPLQPGKGCARPTCMFWKLGDGSSPCCCRACAPPGAWLPFLLPAHTGGRRCLPAKSNGKARRGSAAASRGPLQASPLMRPTYRSPRPQTPPGSWLGACRANGSASVSALDGWHSVAGHLSCSPPPAMCLPLLPPLGSERNRARMPGRVQQGGSPLRLHGADGGQPQFGCCAAPK